MRHEFKLQDPGEGVHEVEINEVLVSEGDRIDEGQDVLVVESDKAAVELPSPHSGKVAEIRVSAGDTAEVGDVLMIIEDGEEKEEKAEQPEGEGAEAEGEETVDETEGPEAEEAEVEKVEAEQEPDEEHAARKEKPTPEKEGEPEGEKVAGKEPRPPKDETTKKRTEEEPIRAAPAARKLAREEGIDLADIEPTGSVGQITLQDVQQATKGRPEPAKKREKAEEGRRAKKPAAEKGVGERDEFGPVERRPLRSIRAATARAMARSWSEIPHVVHHDNADITELERWRRNEAREMPELTITAILAKAVVAVLRRYPRFNARYDTEANEMVLRHYHNINIAVATERGLMTPVLHDVDGKSIRVLASELAGLAERARSGRLSKEALSGGTFTITNVGGIGGTGFSPLINAPQSAILGVARARLTPVIEGDVEDLENATTRIRLLLPLVVAFDHRLLDGADAARFMNDLTEIIEDPTSLVLDI